MALPTAGAGGSPKTNSDAEWDGGATKLALSSSDAFKVVTHGRLPGNVDIVATGGQSALATEPKGAVVSHVGTKSASVARGRPPPQLPPPSRASLTAFAELVGLSFQDVKKICANRWKSCWDRKDFVIRGIPAKRLPPEAVSTGSLFLNTEETVDGKAVFATSLKANNEWEFHTEDCGFPLLSLKNIDDLAALFREPRHISELFCANRWKSCWTKSAYVITGTSSKDPYSGVVKLNTELTADGKAVYAALKANNEWTFHTAVESPLGLHLGRIRLPDDGELDRLAFFAGGEWCPQKLQQYFTDRWRLCLAVEAYVLYDVPTMGDFTGTVELNTGLPALDGKDVYAKFKANEWTFSTEPEPDLFALLG